MKRFFELSVGTRSLSILDNVARRFHQMPQSGENFYDVVAARFRDAGLSREVQVVTRSGCYLTHDAGIYHRAFDEVRRRTGDHGEGPRAALEVWAYVQSRPEREKVLLTMGKRDAVK